mgnify:FL=1
MAVHPNDKTHSTNPRMQCAVCRKWMRLHKAEVVTDRMTQRFYGGCGYTNGDHYPVNGDYDVCDECCHKHCKPKAMSDGKYPADAA